MIFLKVGLKTLDFRNLAWKLAHIRSGYRSNTCLLFCSYLCIGSSRKYAAPVCWQQEKSPITNTVLNSASALHEPIICTLRISEKQTGTHSERLFLSEFVENSKFSSSPIGCKKWTIIQFSQYSDVLQAGRFRDWIPMRDKHFLFSTAFQTSFGAYPTSGTLDTGAISLWQSFWGVASSIQPQLTPLLKTDGGTLVQPICAPQPLIGKKACYLLHEFLVWLLRIDEL
jgi:hypothetical protein